MSKWLLVTAITFGVIPTGALRAGTPQGTPQAPPPDTEDVNVNARYMVEKVDLKRVPWEKGRVSLPLQHEIDKIVGQRLDQETLDNISQRIQKELHVPKVNVRVSKGRVPDRVVVTFEVGQKERDLDLDIDRFLYHSKQGWTGEGGASMTLHGNRFTFGLVSDADRLAERYAGIQAGYERFSLGTDRAGLRFRFGSYHQQWNPNTLAAAAPGDLYRTRQNFMPEVIVRLAEPLEWSAGVDFARYETFIPNPVALGPVARTEASNAAVTTLRYRQRWGSDVDGYAQTLMGSYGLRSGTGLFDSDAIFTRQFVDAAYTVKHGHQTMKVSFLGGRIAGAPPMFERFILGNAETLRGWNKFDLNPVGATRAVHGSVEYIYRHLLFFYDTGSSWSAGEDPEQRQSVGVGLNGGGFEFGVGFPIRSGRANPVVYVGMKF